MDSCDGCLKLKSRLRGACEHYVGLIVQHDQMLRDGTSEASTLDNAIQKARHRLNAAARLLLSHRGTHEDLSSPQRTATHILTPHHRSSCASCLLAGCGFVDGGSIRGENAEI